MSQVFKRVLSAMLVASSFVSAAFAASPQVSVRPQTRIVSKVDAKQTVTVPRSHSTRVEGLADAGRVPAGTQFNSMMLVLKSSEEQEHALQGLLDSQQDKNSPNYHQWMTPDTFAASFGVASTDVAKVTAWLQDSGFTIEKVAKGSRFIQFSGTSAQVEAAFHTEMHQYMVNGEMRVSNSTDIAIPEALSPVVFGVSTLNNFRLQSNMHKSSASLGTDKQLHTNIPGTMQPDYTSASSGNHYVGAGDLSVIYNTAPLLKAGINGKGQKIGILGQTDILLGDIQIYRSMFQLPPNDPNFIIVGNDPGTIADDGESDLDVELSGGLAPGATIDFYLSGNTYFGGGIDASGVYVVENNSDDIISLSYGACEVNLGTSNAFFNTLWEQAASQGITVFVSTGDAGSDVCRQGSSTGANYTANGLASTPYNVAVGGTMFNDGTATGPTSYWGPTGSAPYTTALGYIPEIAWNEGRFDAYSGGYGGIVATSTGISIEYAQPAFQAGPGITGVDPTPLTGSVKGFLTPGIAHRLLPDVSMEAAGGHDGTVYCSEGVCKFNADGSVASLGLVGGTSVAAPSFAGVQALINQKNGGRQGNANYYYYCVAAAQSTTNCNASTLPSSAGANCAFHDVQNGNVNIPTTTTGTVAGGQYLGWPVGPGYDLNVGLGSPDVTNLATQWNTVNFNATTTTFAVTPTSSAHGASLNTTIVVKPVSGTGIPTGDVSIIASPVAYGAVGFYTLSAGSGTITGTLAGLPGGTYNVHAHYAGDATYGGSDSNSVQVTVAPGPSSVVTTSYLLAANGGLSAASTFTYGSNVYIDAQVCDPTGLAAGGCAVGTPTGNITFNVKLGSTTLPSLVSPLDSFDDAYFDSGLGYAGYLIKPNYPSVAAPGLLAPGVYTITAAYGGDTTFNASTSPALTITVGPANQTLSFTTSTSTIASAGPAILNASIATVSAAVGGLPATGTVTFTDTTTNTVLGTGTMVNGAVVFTTNAITTAGAHVISAVYSGDANYLTKTGTNLTITVGGSATTTTLATSLTTSQVGTTVTLTATVPLATSGTTYFYDGSTLLGTANVGAAHTAARTVANFTAGTHNLIATYAGTTTLDSSSSAATPYVVTQNTPTLQLTSQTGNATTAGVSMNATFNPSPVNAAPMVPAPTGVINFLDGSTVLGSLAPTYLPGGYQNYVANFTTKALTPGTHTLSAVYPGDLNYAGKTSNTQTVTIGLTTLSLTTSTNFGGGVPLVVTATATPVVANTAAFTGTVTFYDGAKVIGTGTMNAAGVATLTTGTPTLAPGVVHTLSAVYAGDGNYYTSTSNTASVTLGLTTLALTSSSTNVGTNTSFTLTATIAPVVASPAPTGTVTFYSGATVIGTATPTAGVAKLTTTFTAIGTYTVTAVYSGDANYFGSSSTSSVSIVAVTPGFSITVNPSTLTIQRGNTGVLSLAVTSFGNYSGNAFPTISGLPAGASYIVNVSPVIMNGVNGTQTSSLYITTQLPHNGMSNVTKASFLWLPALMLAGLLGLRRKQLTVRGRQLVVFALLFCGMMAASGCSTNTSSPGTTLGTSTVTVTVAGTGTNAASPNLSPTASVTVTIQ